MISSIAETTRSKRIGKREAESSPSEPSVKNLYEEKYYELLQGHNKLEL